MTTPDPKSPTSSSAAEPLSTGSSGLRDFEKFERGPVSHFPRVNKEEGKKILDRYFAQSTEGLIEGIQNGELLLAGHFAIAANGVSACGVYVPKIEGLTAAEMEKIIDERRAAVSAMERHIGYLESILYEINAKSKNGGQ